MDHQFIPLEPKDVSPVKPKTGIGKYLTWSMVISLCGFALGTASFFDLFDEARKRPNDGLIGLIVGSIFLLVYLGEIDFFKKPSRAEKLASFFSFLKGTFKFLFWSAVILGGCALVIAGFSAFASLSASTLLIIVIVILLFK